MASATDYLAQAVLLHTMGVAVMPMPLGVFAALCTTAPDRTNPGTEVAGGGYLRQSVLMAQVAGANSVANSALVSYPTATAAWGAVSWVELWDVPMGLGNRLYFMPLVDPIDLVTPITKIIGPGDIMTIPPATLIVSAS